MNFIEFSHQFESFFIKFQQFPIKFILPFTITDFTAVTAVIVTINVVTVATGVLTVKFTVNKWGFIDLINWYKNRIFIVPVTISATIPVTEYIVICITMCIVITLYLIMCWVVVNFSLYIKVIED